MIVIKSLQSIFSILLFQTEASPNYEREKRNTYTYIEDKIVKAQFQND